jgi:hypothetical protein
MAKFIKISTPESSKAVFYQPPLVLLEFVSNLWGYIVSGKATYAQQYAQSFICNIKQMK